MALLISIMTYQLWGYFPKGYFYIGNAIFILLICTYIYLQEKQSFVKFVLFELSMANFIKEMFLDTSLLTLGEALLIVIIPFIWYLKYGNTSKLLARNKRNDRRNSDVFGRKKIDKDT